MDGREYRKRLREYALSKGFVDPPQKKGSDWVFTGPLGAIATVLYEPPECFGRDTYLRYQKGLFTTALKAAVRREANKDVPTKNRHDRWLHAFSPDYRAENPTEAGKWMMFFASKYADDTWKNVSMAIREGRLAPHGKVSTAASTPYAMSYVLCVYIPDYQNREEAVVVRERLRALGFKRRIHFKRDSMTERGESGSEFSA